MCAKQSPAKRATLNNAATPFVADDQIKTRSANNFPFAVFDGQQFQGSLKVLEPTKGYQVYVSNFVEFRYAIFNEDNKFQNRKLETVNSGCVPHFTTSSNLQSFPDTATVAPAFVTLN